MPPIINSTTPPTSSSTPDFIRPVTPVTPVLANSPDPPEPVSIPNASVDSVVSVWSVKSVVVSETSVDVSVWLLVMIVRL